MKSIGHIIKVAILSTLIAACGGGGDSGSRDSGYSGNNDGNDTNVPAEPSRLVWDTQLPVASFAYYSSVALSTDEQTLYVGTAKNVRNPSAGNDVVAAYNVDGSILWQHSLPNGEEVRSSPVVHNDTIYVLVEKRTGEFTKAYRDLIALNSLGAQIWRKRVSTYPNQTGSGLSKVVAYNNQIIYTGLDIYAFDAATGDVLYERLCHCSERQDRFMNGAVNHNGELVFFDEGKVLKLNLTDYTLLGEFKDAETFEYDLVLSTPAIDSNNNIYFGSEAGILYSFDDNLALRWRFELGTPDVIEAPHIRSSVAIDESRSTLYFGTKSNENSEFYALDMNDKSVKWQVAIPGDIYVSPAIGDNGNVYFASETDYLYSYNPAGELVWQVDLEVNVTWSSPAIDSNGILYIGGLSSSDLSASDATGKLFAIQTDSTGLMPNTWSKLHKNNQNTGAGQ